MLNPITRYRFKSRRLTLSVRTLDAVGYRFARQRSLRKEQIGKILVIRLDDIGDVILATPVLRNLKESFPDATIDLMVKSSTQDVVVNNPWVNRIWTLEPFWMRTAKPSGPMRWLLLIRQLRKEGYDLVLELRGNPFNLILAFLSGSRHRVGYGAQGLGFLLTAVVPYDNNARHEIDRNLDVLRGLGLPVRSKKPEFFIPDTAARLTERFLKACRVSDDDLLVCIHPGAPWLPKRWPKERFAAVAEALIGKYGSKIVLIGNADEMRLCSAVRDQITLGNRNHVVVAAGITNLHGTAALIKRAVLFIGNDSGPMHMAHAFETNTVALFGPQSPAFFGPLQNRAVAIFKKVECSPCFQKIDKGCPRGLSCCEGLLNITPEDVLTAIEENFSAHLGRTQGTSVPACPT